MVKEEIAGYLRDLLFPVYCVECGSEGAWWCDRCLARKQCAAFQLEKAVCSLDGVTALFNYEENNPIARLIKLYKYQFAREVEDLWKKFISEADLSAAGWGRNAAIVPVPLHPRRQRERGFNQSQILAEIVSGSNGLQVTSGCLQRIKYTSQQAKLAADERQKNLAGAFVWTGGMPPPAEVVLVDDVYTTGATMQECARILKHAGVRRVWGLALAAGG